MSFTTEDIYNANKTEDVFEHCNSVQASISVGEYSAILYADKDFTYIYGDDICEGETDGQTCSYEHGKYLTEFCLDKENENNYERILLLNDYFSRFVISAAEEEGNDLVVTASLNESDTANLMDSMDYDYDDGDITVLKLRVNKDDLIIKEYTVKTINLKKSETVITVKNNFDCEMPADAKQMYEHMNLPDLRTITLIVNPGSDNEYTLTASGIKGDEIQFYSTGDIYISQYEDKECTKDYTTATDSDPNADLVIYGKEFF